MPAMRLTSTNYIPDYGGKLPRNFVLQDIDTETAKRWERNGIAVRDTGEDLAPLAGETPGADVLQAQIASLMRELADVRARENTARSLQEERATQQAADAADADGTPPSPFEGALSGNTLADGRRSLGESRPADDVPEDHAGRTQPSRRSASRRDG